LVLVAQGRWHASPPAFWDLDRYQSDEQREALVQTDQIADKEAAAGGWPGGVRPTRRAGGKAGSSGFVALDLVTVVARAPTRSRGARITTGVGGVDNIVLIADRGDVREEEWMLFDVRITMMVDAMDYTQVEIIALGALQAAKAHVNSQAATVADSSANMTSLEE
jgi:hypothetical protein